MSAMARRGHVRSRAVSAAVVAFTGVALVACPSSESGPPASVDAGADVVDGAAADAHADKDVFVGEICADGTPVGQCLRAVSCVPSCGAASVQLGCCPCPPGTFDELNCTLDAASDAAPE